MTDYELLMVVLTVIGLLIAISKDRQANRRVADTYAAVTMFGTRQRVTSPEDGPSCRHYTTGANESQRRDGALT